MTFNDYKAYRQAMKPILEQKRLLRGTPPEVFDHPPRDEPNQEGSVYLGDHWLGYFGVMFFGSCVHSRPACNGNREG